MVGPAGIGKSRLAREVGEALSERAAVFVGRCLPYGEGITYWALAEIVRQVAGSAEPRAALERVFAGDERAALLADRVLQAAGLEEATTAREDLTVAVRDLFRRSRASAPSCSCSRTCTGRTPPCSTWSSTCSTTPRALR